MTLYGPRPKNNYMLLGKTLCGSLYAKFVLKNRLHDVPAILIIIFQHRLAVWFIQCCGMHVGVCIC